MYDSTLPHAVSSSIIASISEKPVPPHSNTGEPTGAKPSGQVELSALVDAFCFTFGDLVTFEQVQALPAFAGLRWLPMEKGDLGYKAGCYAGGITILYEGHSGMGTHVRMMGQACRFLEGRAEFQGWPAFFRSILRFALPCSKGDSPLYYSAKISRLDGAMDDSTGLLNLERIEQAVRECTIVSTYRKGRTISDFDLKTGKDTGSTIYFGRRDGDSMMRFYDRGAKMGLSESLIRCELELHHEQAQAFAVAIMEGAHFGQLLAGIIRRKLEFKAGSRPEGRGGSEYRAWAAADWWEDFLGHVEKMRLGMAPVVRTLQKGRAWLMRQAAPLLATVLDLGDVQFYADFIEEGRRRRPDWQKALFACPA